MTPERKAIIGHPLTLKERVDIHAVEIAIIAKRVQQLENDQADIMAAFEADRLPVPMRSDLSALSHLRNAKGWDTPA